MTENDSHKNSSAPQEENVLKMSIIGDAFVDIMCVLDSDENNNNCELKLDGGDTRINQAVQILPGGSALNTATCLHALVIGESSYKTDIELQTVLNESDSHGKLILEHCHRHGISLVNNSTLDNNKSSTAHCVVLVSNNERSFLTHLGSLEQYKASDIKITPHTTNETHYIHIAGYYNIPGFWNGALKQTIQNMRKQHENQIIVSLVTQYDATECWDGQLIDLLQEVDVLILNEIEANSVTKYKLDKDIATFFHKASPSTHVIVTKGAEGATSLHQGQVIHNQCACPSVLVVDPTGAGDAFAAGFIHGLCEGNNIYDKHNDNGRAKVVRKTINYDTIRNGLRWGCATGALCIQKIGASIPCDKKEALELKESLI